ncbi:hypothetical protein HaLaN_04663, partial [Haematococcus lacustris]
MNSRRVLQLGNVLSGSVQTIESWGVFVQLDALPKIKALLRPRHISQARQLPLCE